MKQSDDWFDDHDEEIRQLLKNKRLHQNELRARIRMLKKQWFRKKADEAEHFAEVKILCKYQ